MNLEGKSAIVTGGSLGIGTAIAHKLAEYGANVANNYRKHKEEAEEVVNQIKSTGRKAKAVQADISSFQDAGKMVQEVISSASIEELKDLRKLHIQDDSGIITANATANVSITNVAPAAVGTATISKWLTINVEGTDYYIPMWK